MNNDNFQPDVNLTTPMGSFALAVLNPTSGSCQIEDVKRALSTEFGNVPIQIYEVQPNGDLASTLTAALTAGCDQIIVGGGDGTVSAVADLLVGKNVRLAVLPLGTANVLALELAIPTDLIAACRLAATTYLEQANHVKTSQLREIDAMRVQGRHYLTQIGVGIDALMIKSTDPEAKRRLGKLAYIISAIRHILAFRSHLFRVTLDGKIFRFRASQIVIANTGMLGQAPFRWGPDIESNDGRLNACIIKSMGIREYGRLLWVVFRGHREKTPNMQHKIIERSVTIQTRQPLPVQADGEIIGETPVTVELVSKAVSIVVPNTN